MNDLEQLAKEAFERYSLRTTNKKYNWTYLSDDRKVEWMKEVLEQMKYLVDSLNNKFKNPVKTQPHQTSFELGYNQGLNVERLSTITFIDNLHTNLKGDLDNFIYANYERKPRKIKKD